MRIRWSRYEITREKREWTPRRLSAAKRSVEKQFEAMPLFPEMVVDKTVEQRMKRMDSRESRIVATMRSNRARAWKSVRQLLRDLSPNDRATLIQRWNRMRMPGTPEALMSFASLLARRNEINFTVIDNHNRRTIERMKEHYSK